ncbi:MAG TPA: cytochrome c biogenesis CcdA family protein [Candidatus Dormibacteraeota bacterium]|nr:cytochrome c biogenesis CcdA family protein [Candidatus Dormibacteraeota bacterium]
MVSGANALGFGLAFAAGLVSITSPCSLPLLPGYLGYLTGSAMADRRRTLLAAALFVGGFSLVFVALGATASVLGSLLLTYRLPLSRVAGFFILAMGLVLLLEGRVGLLSRGGGDWSRRFEGGRLTTAPALGAAFGITWTPCIGPVLGAILTLAGATASLGQGVALLLAYSLGLAVPFVLLSLSVAPVRAWLRRIRRGMALLQAASAALLVAMGMLLITDRWLPLVAPVLAWYSEARWPPF